MVGTGDLALTGVNDAGVGARAENTTAQGDSKPAGNAGSAAPTPLHLWLPSAPSPVSTKSPQTPPLWPTNWV